MISLMSKVLFPKCCSRVLFPKKKTPGTALRFINSPEVRPCSPSCENRWEQMGTAGTALITAGALHDAEGVCHE